jgi:hypothetical protein
MGAAPCPVTGNKEQHKPYREEVFQGSLKLRFTEKLRGLVVNPAMSI